MADLFDTRLYRTLGLYEGNNSSQTSAFVVKPYVAEVDSQGNRTFGTYVGDYYETPSSVFQGLEDVETGQKGDATNQEYQKTVDALTNKAKAIVQSINAHQTENMAPFSAVHPYALLRLTGASGNEDIVRDQYGIDSRYRRRWYEIDGDASGGYSKNPSTTVLINWANQDPYGRTPYAFQDFVYCKWWNKIQNNRMITLRRYSMPVRDSLDMYKEASTGKEYQQAFAPVATAVTYFGEGTGNTLSDLLTFTVGYNWKEFEGKVWEASGSQNNEGQNMILPNNRYMSNGLRILTQTLGFIDDVKAQQTNGREGEILTPTEAVSAPPDPYNSGPYENRIIGPVNVINKVIGRDRGLKFTQDGLKITFEYVARPIANINNKAIMLDLLGNLLLMTSSTGTFWGGVSRYWTQNPAMYPWKDVDTLNRLYQGKLFGKQSVFTGLVNTAYRQPGNFFMNFAQDLLSEIKSAASGLLDKILNRPSSSSAASSNTNDSSVGAAESMFNTMQRMVSGHLIKSSTIPWITGMRSALTGDPTGEWHLTIGNPLNPIAMVGNLIVDDAQFQFSDELGPDDFPTSFKCVINLKHALGRDREGVESMFNRGYGRIYTLPTNFKTSADGESGVDDFTGANNPFEGQEKWGMTYQLVTSGNNYALTNTRQENRRLQNSGDVWNAAVKEYVLDPQSLGTDSARWNPGFLVVPAQAHWIL